MHCFPLPIGVVAACGAGYRFDPTPNPSFREGLGGASGKIGVSDGRCKLATSPSLWPFERRLSEEGAWSRVRIPADRAPPLGSGFWPCGAGSANAGGDSGRPVRGAVRIDRHIVL